MINCIASIATALAVVCSQQHVPTPAQAAAVWVQSHPTAPAPAPFVAPEGWTYIGPIRGASFGDFYPFYDRSLSYSTQQWIHSGYGARSYGFPQQRNVPQLRRFRR